MDYVFVFFDALIDLSNAMAVYILFGLAFAGILHELVPETLVTKHLGKENITSVVKSTVFGIPLPVCSCGVIPLATSIKKSGASKGATLSFLISTPITGVDSILATFGMFGWVFTIYRVFTSMIIAMAAGILTNVFDKEEKPAQTRFSAAPVSSSPLSMSPSFSSKPKSEEISCCSTDSSTASSEPSCCSSGLNAASPEISCCSSGLNAASPETSLRDRFRLFSLKKAMNYAFGTLLSDIAKPLLWGLLLGALITVAIPENLSEILIEYSWLSYIIVIAIAIPMYVCATASLPIAAALMLSGVSAGAAFVFLSAGPATNTVTIGVVKKMLGSQSLYIYLSSITIGSVIFGLGLDYIFSINDINAKSLVHMHEESGFLEMGSSLVLWAYLLYFFIKSYISRKK